MTLLAQFVFQYHINQYKESYSRVAETILQSTYMDDSMDSVLTDEKGINLYKQLSDLWEKGGMYTHKLMVMKFSSGVE